MTMKKWLALILTIPVLCAAPWPAMAADGPAVLGVLEIRGLDNLADAAFTLSRAANQPTPSEAISLLLYGALGTMPGMGIQPEGKVRVLWLASDTEKGSMALLLPVDNEGTDYLTGLGQAGWKNESETDGGIEHFIPPAGSGMAWNDVYFLKRGATLVAAETADDARKADAALPGLPPILPVEGDMAMQFHPAILMEAFAPQIQEQMDKAFLNPAAPQEAAELGKLYMRGYMSVAKQLDAVTFGLGVANGNLNVHTRVVAVEGTLLAQWLASMRAPAAATSVVNLPGALFAETAHMGDLGLIGPVYFRYMDELMKILPQPADADFMKTYMENAKTYWEQMTGDVGIALLPPTPEKPLRAAEYVGLKDSSVLRTLVQKMTQDAKALMETMMNDTNLPAPFQLDLIVGEPREYRGIPVDTTTYELTPGKPIAAKWPQGIPTKLGIELAWLPGGVLATVGDSALTDTLVDRALDGVVAPVSDLPAWQAAFPNPDDGLVDLTHFALFDTLRGYLSVADAHTGGTLAANIPAGSGNIESSTYPALGGMMNRIRLSLTDINAVAQKIQAAREKAMAEMMRQMEMQGEIQIEDDGFEAAPPMDAEEVEEGNPGVDADMDTDLDGDEVAPAESPASDDSPASAVVPSAAD
jgi:hypothetical protein